MVSAFLLILSLVAVASAKIFYAGVAEGSGEFNVWSSTATPGTGLPGTFGVDYAFINKSAIDIYVDQNGVSSAQWANLKAAHINQWQVNLFRVAFLLERMCPLSYGLGSKFNETVHNRNQEKISSC
jgi:endoglucanase